MNKAEQSRAKQREQAVILLNSKREDSLELLGMSIEAEEIIIQLMINFYNSQQPTPQPDVSEIWIVISDTYSFEGIFYSREKAQEYIDDQPHRKDYGINSLNVVKGNRLELVDVSDRVKQLKQVEDDYYNVNSQHYKDNERYAWAINAINDQSKPDVSDEVIFDASSHLRYREHQIAYTAGAKWMRNKLTK